MRDRELTQARINVEQLLENQERKFKKFEDSKKSLESEKASLSTRVEELKEKTQSIADEFLQRKLEDGREIALFK